MTALSGSGRNTAAGRSRDTWKRFELGRSLCSALLVLGLSGPWWKNQVTPDEGSVAGFWNREAIFADLRLSNRSYEADWDLGLTGLTDQPCRRALIRSVIELWQLPMKHKHFGFLSFLYLCLTKDALIIFEVNILNSHCVCELMVCGVSVTTVHL